MIDSRTVLDKGFVELIDVMGDDKRIVDSARVSVSGLDVKAVQSDRSLIRYLMRHRHTTPFESVELAFIVKCPIFVARQWHRHRTASYNEVSARYSVLEDDFYIPDPDRVQVQSSNNKQGSGQTLPAGVAEEVRNKIKDHSAASYSLYEDLLGKNPSNQEMTESGGLARELARSVLPVNMYTKFFFKQNLWNFMHFIELRMHPHAQEEIRVYADAMYSMVKNVAPHAMEAFDDYVRCGTTLSRAEVRLIKLLLVDPSPEDLKTLGSKREIEEFLRKFDL